VAAVDQDGELDGRGSADAAERIEGGLNRAARVQDVVHQDDCLSIDAGDWNQRFLGGTQRLAGQVVAEHRGVDDRQVRVGAGHFANPVDKPAREGGSASRNAGDDEIVTATVALDDFVGDACQRAGDVACSQYFFAARCAISVQ
jgi:hypothetical protein